MRKHTDFSGRVGWELIPPILFEPCMRISTITLYRPFCCPTSSPDLLRCSKGCGYLRNGGCKLSVSASRPCPPSHANHGHGPHHKVAEFKEHRLVKTNVRHDLRCAGGRFLFVCGGQSEEQGSGTARICYAHPRAVANSRM